MSQTDPAARYRTAGALLRQGDFSGALRIFDELIAANPQAAPLHFHRSHCLSQMERYDDAIAAMDTVLRLAPDHVPALLARAELGGDENFDALPLLQRAATIEPDNARALYLLAEAELWCSDDPHTQAQGLEHLERSLTLEPDQPQALVLRAEQHYRAALTEEDGEHVVRTLTGLRYLRPCLEAALADYQRAAVLEPSNNRHDYRCAQTAELLGRYEVATKHLDAMLARLPEDAPNRDFLQEERNRCAQGEIGAREQLASLLESAGTSEQAERSVEEDMAYALTHSAAALVRQGQDVPSALEALAGDDSPQALAATGIAFQIYNYAHEPDPNLLEVEEKDYPAWQRKHADTCEKAIASLGYSKLADAEAMGLTAMQGFRTMLRVFTHPKYGVAVSFAIKPKWPGFLPFLQMFFSGQWKTVRLLECLTHFDDDVFMSTRAAGPDPFDNSAIANYLFEKLPAKASPRQVAERHLARVKERCEQGHFPLRNISLEDVEDIWRNTNTIKAEYRRSIDYITDTELKTILGSNYDTLAPLIRQRLELLARGGE